MMKQKYGHYSNFEIINDDFVTYDFAEQKFDMIYSAAAIQWIPEETAFSKTLKLLNPGGILAMMFTEGDYKAPNEALYNRIQKVYDEHFKPDIKYEQGGFQYENAIKYGYVDWKRREYYGKRELTAEEYVGLCGTHCDHIVIPNPHKTEFFNGTVRYRP